MVKFILFIFALQSIFVPFSQALNDDGTLVEGSNVPPSSGNVPCIICAFSGTSRADAKFKFSADIIPYIPDRCEALIYGYFRIDEAPTSQDIKNMKSLRSKGKKIWTFVSYIGDLTWDILMGTNATSAQKKQMDTLTSFINDNKISAVILDMIWLWTDEICDLADKMNGFICRLKEQCPGVLVGLTVPRIDYKNFSQEAGFDFALANQGLDFYFIDTYTIGIGLCQDNTSSIGNLPLTVDDTFGNTDDVVTTAVENSEMDKSKLVLNFVLETKTETGSSSYSEYCCQAKGGSKLWCADPLSKCYKEGEIAKNLKYHGLSTNYLDFDDYDGSCGCGYFPVTNAFIDGFQSADVPCCAAIDSKASAGDGLTGGQPTGNGGSGS